MTVTLHPITLHPITEENWHACIALQVTDAQVNYVAPNVYSIAESRFEPTWVPLAIYAEIDGEAVMVGFAMYDSRDYEIIRFMVDARYQGRGFGRAAMLWLLAQFERERTHPSTSLSFVPGNTAAEQLYASVGFRKTGEINEGELVMVRPL
jgi:diamine N-acetyltransferase